MQWCCSVGRSLPHNGQPSQSWLSCCRSAWIEQWLVKVMLDQGNYVPTEKSDDSKRILDISIFSRLQGDQLGTAWFTVGKMLHISRLLVKVVREKRPLNSPLTLVFSLFYNYFPKTCSFPSTTGSFSFYTCLSYSISTQNLRSSSGILLRQDPLDLSFWSFLTFLHHGIEEIERHLLWKVY